MDIATLASENEVDEAPSAISMLELSEMLSARTYLADKAPGSEPSTKLVAECREDWNRLNASLCSERRPTEGALVVARGPAVEKKPTAGPFVGFAIVERAETVEGAEECAVDAARQMSRLLATDLQFASFEPVCERERLESVVAFVESSSGVELRRRTVRMEVTDGNDPHGESKIGFVRSGEDARESTDEEDEDVEVLCPWKPSIDPWVRLFESLESEPGTAGLVVRFRGLDVAPEEARLRAGRELARAERLKEEYGGQSAGSTVSTGRLQRAIERTDEFVSALDGSVMAQRVSVVRAEGEVSDALVQTVGSSIDQHTGGFESETAPLAGGFEEQTIESVDLFGELSVRGPRDLFSPRAAGAALRLPMPPRGGCTTGLNVRRARQYAPQNSPEDGTGIDIGCTGTMASNDVDLGDEDRFRHTYMVGQTGTGKSTLMGRMALQDIRRGRGVTVLDPHGTLVDDLLARIPEDRVDDVVLLDATDRQRPVPFNPLRIEADSERAYRRRRDRVIDAFMRYVEARFPEEYYGPIFETHLRGMLGLLLGSTPQDPARVPNLMLLFGLYSNEEFRDRMIEKRRGEDLMIDSFVDEVRQASYDASFDEMGTYVTSKFNRFVFDRTLRNITCQPDALDIEACVEDRKILLVSLGKGRFGDLSAGLLASQIVDRLRSAVLGRQTAEPAHYLYADEFQLFAGQQFGQLLSEARKFGLAVTAAHQYTSQLDREVIDSVLGNVGTRIAFRVGAADAERLAPEFRPRFSEEDLVSLSNYRCCVAPTGELGELPFTLETRPYRETADPRIAESARERSRLHYGRGREAVERRIRQTWEWYVEDEAPEDESSLLEELVSLDGESVSVRV